MMLGGAELIAFSATATPAEARAFYEGVLGLRLVADEPFALVFDANGVTLRVAKVTEVAPPPYTVLGWKVADIAAAVDVLSSRGAVFERFEGMEQDERGIWRSPGGARIAWFRDPAGNTLSLTQF